MKLFFLGTAASEGYPNAFCDCENCQQARALGGASLRKRSAALINDDLLIDLGPDLMAGALQHGISLAKLRYCLQTHEHSDHLDPSHFGSRSTYCGVYGNPRLHYFASRGALQYCSRSLRADGIVLDTVADGEVLDLGDKINLIVHPIQPFQEFDAGPYHVLSIAANHDPSITAMLYVIEEAGRVLFYATDTGEIAEESWNALKAYGRRFNVVALDHTFGFGNRSNGHLNREQFLEQVARMRQEGLLAEDARIYAHHLAHHSNPPYPQLVDYAHAHGYEVAYDGLQVEV